MQIRNQHNPNARSQDPKSSKKQNPATKFKQSQNTTKRSTNFHSGTHLGLQIRPVPELPIPEIREGRRAAVTQKINAIGCRITRGLRGSGSGNTHAREFVLVRVPAGNRVVEAAPPLKNECERSEGQREECEEQEETRSEGLRGRR